MQMEIQYEWQERTDEDSITGSRKCLDNSKERGLPKVGTPGKIPVGQVFGWTLKDFRWYSRQRAFK